MLRPVRNPPNPFAKVDVDWDVPPSTDLQVFEEEARSILAENESPDVPFRYSLNPYRGCQHACAYCYARPSHELLGFGAGTDFETRIVVKTNAPELLRRRFEQRSWQGELIAFSGETDCYQPLEASYELTRRCLEVCLEYRNPVGVITKATLIRRDAGLLGALTRESRSSVTMSLAFADDGMARRIEPGAPPPSRRFAALRALADAGVDAGILIAPVIPGLNDSQIPEVLERAAAAGAQRAGLVCLRLPGSVRQVFLERLAEAEPERARRVEQRVREVRGGGLYDARYHRRQQGQGPYWDAIEDLFELHCARLGLAARSPDGEPPMTTFRRPGPIQLELF